MSSPMKLLRSFPELKAKETISLTMTLIPMLPEDLYDLLVRHPYDPMILDILTEMDQE